MEDRTTFFNAMTAMGATPWLISATFTDELDTIGWDDENGMWKYLMHDMAEYHHTVDQMIAAVGRTCDNCDVAGAFGMWVKDHLEFSATSAYAPALDDFVDPDIPLVASIVAAQAELKLQTEPDALGGAHAILAALQLSAPPDILELMASIAAAPEWQQLTASNRIEIQAHIVRAACDRLFAPEGEPRP